MLSTHAVLAVVSLVVVTCAQAASLQDRLREVITADGINRQVQQQHPFDSATGSTLLAYISWHARASLLALHYA